MKKQKAKRKKQYWYRIYLDECPVCSRSAEYRERVYGPLPTDKKDRYVNTDYLGRNCGCLL